MSAKERPVSQIPKGIIVVLFISLLLQLSWHYHRPVRIPEASDLPATPDKKTILLASLGEAKVSAKILMLWLQAFDYQPGISIPFKNLDYNRLVSWLDMILSLDTQSRYPLLSAARVYSEVPDELKKRMVLAFVYEKFLLDPEERWPWMAHAVYVAKHRLQDLNLAYKYARAIRLHARGKHVPDWAKQMEIFILEDIGDIEGAKILIGGLLESGVIKDSNEMKFLEERLDLSLE